MKEIQKSLPEENAQSFQNKNKTAAKRIVAGTLAAATIAGVGIAEAQPAFAQPASTTSSSEAGNPYVFTHAYKAVKLARESYYRGDHNFDAAENEAKKINPAKYVKIFLRTGENVDLWEALDAVGIARKRDVKRAVAQLTKNVKGSLYTGTWYALGRGDTTLAALEKDYTWRGWMAERTWSGYPRVEKGKVIRGNYDTPAKAVIWAMEQDRIAINDAYTQGRSKRSDSELANLGIMEASAFDLDNGKTLGEGGQTSATALRNMTLAKGLLRLGDNAKTVEEAQSMEEIAKEESRNFIKGDSWWIRNKTGWGLDGRQGQIAYTLWNAGKHDEAVYVTQLIRNAGIRVNTVQKMGTSQAEKGLDDCRKLSERVYKELDAMSKTQEKILYQYINDNN